MVVQHAFVPYAPPCSSYSATDKTIKTKQTKQISKRITKFDKYLRILYINIYRRNETQQIKQPNTTERDTHKR